MGSSLLREVIEAMEIDAVPEFDRDKDKDNEKQLGTGWIRQLTTVI